jgi:hypothetical protein
VSATKIAALGSQRRLRGARKKHGRSGIAPPWRARNDI